VLAALNFAIEHDRALHDHLRGLAGRRMTVEFDGFAPLKVPSVSAQFALDGLLEAVRLDSPEAADVRLTLSPAFFLATAEQLLSGQAAAVSLKGLRIEGDAEVAQQLVPLIQLMRSRLSPFGQAASQSWPVQAAQRAAHFAVHETDVLATRPMVEAQQQALQALRDRIARFEKRLQAFESRAAP